jgi:heptosyltransferase-2/heptosyltransferase-3
MCLPALFDLRAAAPRARIRLVVGRWSEQVARGFPVDEVLVWSAPWVGRPEEGAESFSSLWSKARALRREGIDVGFDLQGDLRAALLLWATGTRVRVGYANTGGEYLLSLVAPLDETVSWVEQNRRTVAIAAPQSSASGGFALLTEADQAFANAFLAEHGLHHRHPLVGLHPSGGRRVKQWDLARWREVARRLQRDFGATILTTGSAADQPLAAAVAEGLTPAPVDLTGRLDVHQSLAVISRMDLFLSADTGPMHLACAGGTPSVSVFGPSDSVRYFTGGAFDGVPERHVVVRHELWCSPCNRIRRPPRECAGPEGPECLRLVEVDDVYRAAAQLLQTAGGFSPREASP